MKIAILGCRGIPNNYGGFEQLAEYLSQGLLRYGHEVYVYAIHTHAYQKKTYNGVHILHKYDPEGKIGTAGQFIYDLNCILDSRKRNFDIILQLGYNSNSIWHWLLPKKAITMTNMDGLEWKRDKYGSNTKKFLQYAEKLAVFHSDFRIADGWGIQRHIKDKFGMDSHYIAYGAHVFENPNAKMVEEQGLKPYQYDIIVARLEPENNAAMMIEGFSKTNVDRKLVVIGNHETKHGEYLKNKFKDERILFFGKVFDINLLNNLRYHSNVYLHGHTVGGTPPSLIEAMASSTLICAHDNVFNRDVLLDKAYYFKDAEDVSKALTTANKPKEYEKVTFNVEKVRNEYNWGKIIDEYESYMRACYEKVHSLSKTKATTR